jgi:hypothetical protein
MRKPESRERRVRCIANKNVAGYREMNAILLRHRQRFLLYFGRELSQRLSQKFRSQGGHMPAIAEILSTVAMKPDPRGCDLPTCPVCADTMVAAEASAYLNDHVISYLWTCDTCGYGFVTKHSVKRFACN